MARKQSRPVLSTIASDVLNRKKWIGLSGETLNPKLRYVPVGEANALLATAKALAGSVLSQDETKGGK